MSEHDKLHSMPRIIPLNEVPFEYHISFDGSRFLGYRIDVVQRGFGYSYYRSSTKAAERLGKRLVRRNEKKRLKSLAFKEIHGRAV